MDLTDAQIERYSRQIILPALGGRGQQRLLASTVRVVGAGPLAATTAWYLTAAGIGLLELWTSTEVALDRLQALRQDLATLNPDTTVELRVGQPEPEPPYNPPLVRGDRASVSPSLPRRGLGGGLGSAAVDSSSNTDILVCADVTAAVLEQVNRIALRQRVPLLAGCGGAQPHIARYAGHDGKRPCAACDPQPPVREAEGATPDPTIGLIGSLLALEAIKASLGLPGFRFGIGLHYEPETLTITECSIGKRATCGACAPAGGFET